MREGLGALTLRGRAFVAGGVSAVVCAILLGQPTLTRVGLLLLVLPFLLALLIGRASYRFALTRTLTPPTVAAGRVATIDVELLNEGRTPLGVMLLEEQLPYALGNRPRFVLEGIGSGWRRHLRYQLRSDVRGRFEIGPMTVRVSDPFGLVELGRSFSSTADLIVTPRVVALPAIPLSGELSGSGENRPRSFTAGSAEDVTVREYRRGDDLRRVHWRSSARVGELMVRQEEQPWQSRATILLDDRLGAHRGHGSASSLETAVSMAASIVAHLASRGFLIRLVTASGRETAERWHDRSGPVSDGALLRELALLEGTTRHRLDLSWLGESGLTGVVVAVLGETSEADEPSLQRIRQRSAGALAVRLDVGAWGGSAATAPAALMSGWRTTRLGPREPAAACWERLARSGNEQTAYAG